MGSLAKFKRSEVIPLWVVPWLEFSSPESLAWFVLCLLRELRLLSNRLRGFSKSIGFASSLSFGGSGDLAGIRLSKPFELIRYIFSILSSLFWFLAMIASLLSPMNSWTLILFTFVLVWFNFWLKISYLIGADFSWMNLKMPLLDWKSFSLAGELKELFPFRDNQRLLCRLCEI